MSLNPFAQFQTHSLVDISLLGYDVSFTNSAMFMLMAVALVGGFFYFSSKYAVIIPGKLQSSAELIFEFVGNTLHEAAGKASKPFFPFIFTLFTFILTLNLLGMMPYGFTVTSHVSVTFAIATMIFLAVTITGFAKHGLKFLSLFLPHGTPMYIAPLMILIELFSFLSRPVSLSIRLAGNMIAGHVLLKVLAGFVVMMGVYGIVPIPFMVVMVGFELFVAILQAYLFTILACVYLNDAINLH